MSVNEPIKIPYADFPEQAGISSKEIQSFIRDYEENGYEFHSLMIIRNGKIAYEGYRAPYNKEAPHTMYSVSKSFTSVAIGFAIDEGLLTLDTKVLDIFPEFRPKKPDEKLESMTVYHLLTMTAGKDVSFLSDKTKDRWVADFFNSKWAFAPGEGWRYISENTYMCCAIIKKLTGQGVIDYLTPRLFKPLGINRRPFWETDLKGLEAGGWGLFITTDELARFLYCLKCNGKYDGKQVIPEWYVKEATRKQVDNPQYDDEHSCVGYGYFFWMNNFGTSYRVDGMFSQFGLVFPQQDAVIITTCSEANEASARDCVFRHIPDIFIEPTDEPEIPVSELVMSPLESLPAAPRSVMEEFIKGKIIHFAKNPLLNAVGFPTSVLPIAVVYMSASKAGNIDNVVFNFDKDSCTMSWDEGKEHNIIQCGMDGTPRYSRMKLAGIPFTAVSYAAWKTDNELEVWIRPLESISERRLVFEFKGEDVTLNTSCQPDLRNIAGGIKDAVETFIPIEPVARLGGKLLMNLDKILEAPLFGRIV